MATKLILTMSTEPEAEEKQDCSLNFLTWSQDEVALWIEQIGLGIYKDCFLSNYVTGRKLIHIHASTLPALGITDWTHIKVITKETRKLLQIEDPNWNRSITLPPASELGMFLLKKSPTGRNADKLTY